MNDPVFGSVSIMEGTWKSCICKTEFNDSNKTDWYTALTSAIQEMAIRDCAIAEKKDTKAIQYTHEQQLNTISEYFWEISFHLCTAQAPVLVAHCNCGPRIQPPSNPYDSCSIHAMMQYPPTVSLLNLVNPMCTRLD